MAKAHKNADFVLGDGCRELSTTRHEPCGVHLAAVRQAKKCRNLPRNLPRACRRAYYREQAARLPAAAHTAVALPPRSYRKKATAVCYRRHTCRRTTCRRVCYRNLPPRPTCRATTPANLPTGGAYDRAMDPAPSGRVIRM